MNVIGEVEGYTCLILDDISDTSGTLVKAAQALKDKGANEVYAFITHPVLSGPAVENITDSIIKKIYVSDTIPLAEKAADCPKIDVISVADVFSQAIIRIHKDNSISSLFTIHH